MADPGYVRTDFTTPVQPTLMTARDLSINTNYDAVYVPGQAYPTIWHRIVPETSGDLAIDAWLSRPVDPLPPGHFIAYSFNVSGSGTATWVEGKYAPDDVEGARRASLYRVTAGVEVVFYGQGGIYNADWIEVDPGPIDVYTRTSEIVPAGSGWPEFWDPGVEEPPGPTPGGPPRVVSLPGRRRYIPR